LEDLTMTTPRNPLADALAALLSTVVDEHDRDVADPGSAPCGPGNCAVCQARAVLAAPARNPLAGPLAALLDLLDGMTELSEWLPEDRAVYVAARTALAAATGDLDPAALELPPDPDHYAPETTP
jgi:hypothetical protein